MIGVGRSPTQSRLRYFLNPKICTSPNLFFFHSAISHSDGLPGKWIGRAGWALVSPQNIRIHSPACQREGSRKAYLRQIRQKQCCRQALRAFIREHLFVSLLRACAESLASENASRLAAMQCADRNIGELLTDLDARFHRLRQSGIDEELFDVRGSMRSDPDRWRRINLDLKEFPVMRENKSAKTEQTQWRISTLSRWENEGGATCGSLPSPTTNPPGSEDAPKLTDAEMVQLRIRVIALENLVIALLAEAPQWQLDRVREMAAYISPRPGFTLHPVTIAAATEMLSLVNRAAPFRSSPPDDL